MTAIRTLIALTLLSVVHTCFADTTYSVDLHHSYVGFKVKHMAISNVKGRFSDFAGTFTLDDNGALTAVSGTVVAKSINTENEKRDAHLRKDDFFGVDEHPELTFKMKSLTHDNGNDKMAGILTIRGISRPVVFDVNMGGTVIDPWGNKRAGFEATTTINRQDFGVRFNGKLKAGGLVVADDVTIMLEIEGIRQEPQAK